MNFIWKKTEKVKIDHLERVSYSYKLINKNSGSNKTKDKCNIEELINFILIGYVDALIAKKIRILQQQHVLTNEN